MAEPAGACCGAFAGSLTNFVWSAILILRNHSVWQFVGEPGFNPMRAAKQTGETLTSIGSDALSDLQRIATFTLLGNYFFTALPRLIWFFRFFFYFMGQTRMGKYDFSSWTLHIASIIIFATLWGVALRELRGTLVRTKALIACGLFLLVGSTVIVGYGNYMKAVSGLYGLRGAL